MKRLRATKHPVIHWTPLRFCMGPMLVIADIFSRLASIPRSKTMKQRSIPLGTPNTHFSGLSLTFFSYNFAKDVPRSFSMSFDLLDLTTMSST